MHFIRRWRRPPSLSRVNSAATTSRRSSSRARGLLYSFSNTTAAIKSLAGWGRATTGPLPPWCSTNWGRCSCTGIDLNHWILPQRVRSRKELIQNKSWKLLHASHLLKFARLIWYIFITFYFSILDKKMILFYFCATEVVCSQRGRIRLPGRSWDSCDVAAIGRLQHWLTLLQAALMQSCMLAANTGPYSAIIKLISST